MKTPFWWVTMLKPRPWPGFLTRSAVTMSYISSSGEGSSRRTTRRMTGGVWRSAWIAFSWVTPSRLSPQTYTAHKSFTAASTQMWNNLLSRLMTGHHLRKIQTATKNVSVRINRPLFAYLCLGYTFTYLLIYLHSWWVSEQSVMAHSTHNFISETSL